MKFKVIKIERAPWWVRFASINDIRATLELNGETHTVDLWCGRDKEKLSSLIYSLFGWVNEGAHQFKILEGKTLDSSAHFTDEMKRILK